MKDLISVIVPVYNVESYLNRCIESLVRQTYKYLEIILVDDGSLDGCPHICDKWSERDNRIHVIHKTNGGLSSARNAGLKVAKGEYIAFLDKSSRHSIRFNCSELKQYSLKESISIVGSRVCIGLLSQLMSLKRNKLK